MNKFHFIDRWCGDRHEFSTLREAKKAAKVLDTGFPIYIYKGSELVATVESHRNPLP